jgi:hypothetical protein
MKRSTSPASRAHQDNLPYSASGDGLREKIQTDIGLDKRWRCANLLRKDVATDNGRRPVVTGGLS